MDTVAVKGRKQGVKIYTARRDLSAGEKEAWGLHNLGMAEYYERSFGRAIGYFRDVLKLLPRDAVAAMLLSRSQRYMKNPATAGMGRGGSDDAQVTDAGSAGWSRFAMALSRIGSG